MTKQPPIEVLCSDIKQQIINIINQAGMPPIVIDSLLCSVLAEVRNEEIYTLLNYSKKIQAEAKGTEADKKEK